MKMLNIKQVSEIFGFSVASIRRLIVAEKFPAGNKLGVSIRWADYIIEAYAILYWGLDTKLPTLTEQESAELYQCLEKVKADL